MSIPAIAPATQPVRSLPEGYYPSRRINLRENIRLALWLNVAAFGVLLLAGALLVKFLSVAHPDLLPSAGNPFRLDVNLVKILGIILTMALVLLTHEAIHGLFFWTATHAKPVFGLHLSYAYAAAPEWFIPSRIYSWIGLAPLLLLDLLLFLWMWLAPGGILLYLAVGFLMNTSGAVGDLWIMYTLFRQPPGCLVNDRGDEVVFYVPSNSD
jgi:hypothetical protein